MPKVRMPPTTQKIVTCFLLYAVVRKKNSSMRKSDNGRIAAFSLAPMART